MNFFFLINIGVFFFESVLFVLKIFFFLKDFKIFNFSLKKPKISLNRFPNY